MSTGVLDSWAVLRFLEDAHPAAAAVEELLDGGRQLIASFRIKADHPMSYADAFAVAVVDYPGLTLGCGSARP